MGDRRPPEQVEESANRRAEVVRLRRTGMTFEDIGNQLGISKQAAHKLWHKTMKGIPVVEVEAYRTEQRMRLDALLQRANEILETKHVVVQHGRVVELDGEPLRDRGPELDAIKTIIDIEQRRAKLDGLDTPVKQQLEVDGGLRYEVVGVDVADLA
ncbi:hypothetical protein [Nonomuraea bangladeshensis]|uniref:hypothetical protein n=1 Tax=Nonomuraea bangladeshensis TaxID=404385 RepID=UPI0031E0E68C